MAEAKPKILMVARGQNAASPLAELNDRSTFCLRKAVAGIDGHQPKLVEVRVRKLHEHAVVVVRVHLFISCNYIMAVGFESFAQEGKARNVPVVLGERDGSL